MHEGEELRLLGALLVVIGLGLGLVQPSLYVSLVGLLLGAAALLFLLRGRPAHLLGPSAVALVAVSLQALGPPTSLALLAGTGLLLWSNRDQLPLPKRLGRRRRLLLLGLLLLLAGLFLPWEAVKGHFAGGFTHELSPVSGEPVSVYDPLVVWIPAEQLPGRQLLGALLPLLAWGALVWIALSRKVNHQRLAPPLLGGLLLWWALQRSLLFGGLLYLIGLGLAGFAVFGESVAARQRRAVGRPPRAGPVPAPGLRSGRPRPPIRRGGAPG